MSEKTVKILNCSGDSKQTIERIDSTRLLNLDNKNCSRMELFLFAMALGVESGIETELSKTETLVRGEYINTRNEAFLYSVYLAELVSDKELETIEDIGNVYGKAQKYANTGFKLINDMFEKSEEVVRLELLKELDDMYHSIANDLVQNYV